MERVSVLGVIGALAAFAASSLALWSLFAALRRDAMRRTPDGLGEGARGRVALLVRKGVPLLGTPSRLLLRHPAVGRFAADGSRWCEGRGLACPERSFVSLVLAFAIILMVVGSVVTQTLVGGLVLDASFVALAVVRLQAWKEQVRDSSRNAVPVALNVMGDCFQSGLSLVQTMQHVSEETEGPMSLAFGRCADILKLGGTSHEALAQIKGIDGVEELSFVAVALDVQHQSGGSFAQVLSNAQRMVADEIELRRTLRVQTAQARLSAQVVCLMPFVLMAVLSLMSEGFLDAFLQSPSGLVMLAVALFMEGAGITMVRKMLKVVG